MIHIWLPNQQAPLRVWQETTNSWQIAENWQEVAALINLQQSSKSKNNPACLYFPSLNLLKLQPDLTAAQVKSLGESGRQYLFEDISITSVEDLEIKTTQDTSLTTLYALHATDRDSWMNAAQLAGITVVALLPDFLLVPTIKDFDISNSAVFYQDAVTQLMRFGSDFSQGIAVSHLPIQLNKLPRIENLYLTGDAATNLPEIAQQLEFLPNLSIFDSNLLPTPVSEPTRQLLNFAVVKRDTKVAPYAKAIAAVFISAVVMALITDGLRWYYYQKAEQQAKTILKQQYEQWFPNEHFKPQLNIQRQLSGKLINQQSNTPSVMSTLSNIQPILRQYQINAKQLNFQNNHLQLQLMAKDNEGLNKAVSAMNAQGIAAKLGAVSQNNLTPQPNQTTGSPSTSGAIAAVDISL